MRLHELAKELNVNSKDLLKLSKELGLGVKSHSSNLAPGEISLLKAAVRYAGEDNETVLQTVEDRAQERRRQAAEERKARQKRALEHRADQGGAGEAAVETAPSGEEAAGAEQAVVSEPGMGVVGEDSNTLAETDISERPDMAPVVSGESGVAGAGKVSGDLSSDLELETQPDVQPGLVPGGQEFEEAPSGTVADDSAQAVESRESQAGAATPEAVEAAREGAAVTPAGVVSGGDGQGLDEGVVPAETTSVAAETGKEASGVAAVAGAGERSAPADARSKKPRRGARIVGRIELPTQAPLRSDSERAAGAPAVAGRTGRDASERERERSRPRSRTKSRKWEPRSDEFAGGGQGAGAVQRPKFWERGPQRRQGRRMGGGRTRVPRRVQPTMPPRKVAVTAPISIKDLSQALGIKAQEILVKFLMKGVKGININSVLDEEGIELLALEFDREIDVTEAKDAEDRFREQRESFAIDEDAGPELLRAPVVTFLGHVDHGKTSLLDRIRSTDVAAGEAGGITQHVRAHRVQTAGGQWITFLDTPGHRAFTEMRMRGAQITDLVVLVVAADDGVMPQTEEAYQHARAAGDDLPIVVALNKIDKADANPMRVKQQLATLGLLPEEFGGETGVIEVSATTGDGVDALLERISLEAELREFVGHSQKPAEGRVVEAGKSQEIGTTATVLVRDGTLRVGDTFLCGLSHGKVRAMFDDKGRHVAEAGPSVPVLVTGFDDVPSAGDEFLVVSDARHIKDVVGERREKARQAALQERQTVTLENLSQILSSAGKVQEIALVVKSDVQGTLEVVKREIGGLKHEEVEVKIIRDALGGITEDDVVLARASDAVVIGFNVIADDRARQLADERGVEIRTYQVIYELIDDMKKAIEGVLKPVERETVTGHAEVRRVFKVSRLGSVAGCYVTDGSVRRASSVRIVREGRIIYTGRLDSLRRVKDDVREIKEGFECGMKVAGYDDIKDGDVIEAFEIVEEKRDVDWSEQERA